MKRIYLVKKDPSKPCGKDNWIIMDRDEFLAFIRSDSGKLRAKDFGKLNAYSSEDYMIIAECGEEEAAKWRSQKDKEDYMGIKEGRMKQEGRVLSLDHDYGHALLDEVIQDPAESVADTVLVRVMRDDLNVAVLALSEEEKQLIQMMFLSEDPMTEEQYSAYTGLKRGTVHYWKVRTLRKLRELIEP